MNASSTRRALAIATAIVTAGVLVVAALPLVAAPPTTSTTPAKNTYKQCHSSGVCFVLLTTGDRYSLSGPPPPGWAYPGFDIWFYVLNPSTDLTRPAHGEDVVVAHSLEHTEVRPDGTSYTSYLDQVFPDRWVSIIHPAENRRIMYAGYTGAPDPNWVGTYKYVSTVALTFRGQDFSITVTFYEKVLP